MHQEKEWKTFAYLGFLITFYVKEDYVSVYYHPYIVQHWQKYIRFLLYLFNKSLSSTY